MAVIEASGLTKRYGNVTAVDGVDFEVGAGEVFGLLGPNGAGKTTTVEMLEGYRTPDSGSVRVLGVSPAQGGPAWRDRIGIVLQQSGIEGELTVRESLTHLQRMYATPADVDATIERADLTEKADARIKALSGGQRRRVDLAAAIIGKPELLFLDEPTTGFDPAARREAWRLVSDLTAGGTTVILTTHYLDEAQHLADRVAVISHGRIVAHGDPSTLGGRDVAVARIRFRLDPGIPPPVIAGLMDRGDGWLTFSSAEPVRAVHDLTGWALEGEVSLHGLEITRPTLEDVYLDLVGAS